MGMTDLNSVDTPEVTGCDCVAEAAREILGAACGLELCPCEDIQELGSGGVVIGVICILGDVDWAVFLGLPRETAMAMVKAFCGFEVSFDSEDMGDAVGELSNILAGDVKRRLEARSLNAVISLPSVVRAESLRVLVQSGTSAVKTCFTCSLGKLWTGVISSKEGGFVA